MPIFLPKNVSNGHVLSLCTKLRSGTLPKVQTQSSTTLATYVDNVYCFVYFFVYFFVYIFFSFEDVDKVKQ